MKALIASVRLWSSRPVRASRRLTGSPAARLAARRNILRSPPEQGRLPASRAVAAAVQSIAACTALPPWGPYSPIVMCLVKSSRWRNAPWPMISSRRLRRGRCHVRDAQGPCERVLRCRVRVHGVSSLLSGWAPGTEAMRVTAGMPRSVMPGCRAIRASSAWSLSVTVARETRSPSSSPSHPSPRLGDPCGQAVADENQAGPLRGIDAEQGASFAGHFVDAACPVSTATVAEGDLAPFNREAKELLPFGVGGRAVVLGRAELAAACQERPVAGDDLLGVDRVVTHGGIEVLVTQDQLADVRGQAVLQRLGGEDPSHVVGGEGKRATGAGHEACRRRGVLDAPFYVVPAEWPVLCAGAVLEQQR